MRNIRKATCKCIRRSDTTAGDYQTMAKWKNKIAEVRTNSECTTTYAKLWKVGNDFACSVSIYTDFQAYWRNLPGDIPMPSAYMRDIIESKYRVREFTFSVTEDNPDYDAVKDLYITADGDSVLGSKAMNVLLSAGINSDTTYKCE